MDQETYRTTKEQLAEWIGIGLKQDGVIEDHEYPLSRPYHQSEYRCCALGLALTGKIGSPEKAYRALHERVESPQDYLSAFAFLLDISRERSEAIDNEHCERRISARSIADRLRKRSI
ncbi:MAG: hypothetical protein M3458_16870 [Acidobacteriota bacterium]|nr:hypothetical protein [Acidobacteriota bacterium]